MALSGRLRPWAAPAVWCGVILAATSVPLPAESLPATDLPLDALGHLVLYAGLGWSVGRAARRSGWRGPGAAAAVWLGGLAFAALDEWHQTLVPTRVTSVADWTADAAGLTLGLTAAALTVRLGSGTARAGGRTPSTARGGRVDGNESDTDSGKGSNSDE